MGYPPTAAGTEFAIHADLDCERKLILTALQVGKLDYERPDGINDQMIGTKATNPPTSHTRMTGLLEMLNIVRPP